jgi:hypothetical protein
MPKQTPTEEPRRRDPGSRRVRQPWHLEELEAAAQTDVDSGDDEAQRRATLGGGLPAQDSEQVPVADSGLSVEPEDLGRQFLRGATDQDNFESEFQAESPTLRDLEPPELLTEAELLSDSAEPEPAEEPDEQDDTRAPDVDLLSNVIHEASLFDRPTEQDVLSPRVESDETQHTLGSADAREREQERERRVLRKLRFNRPSSSVRRHPR